tara:strand:- start:1197 stop:1643 length:447 start_codon:yes stop_codon:yes gene_type:complete
MHNFLRACGQKLLSFGILLPCLIVVPNLSQAEVKLYACQEEKSIGFFVKEGMRQVKFELERFTLKYDTDENTLFSQKLSLFGNLPPLQRCDMDIVGPVLTCFTRSGDAFSFNTSVLSFVRTSVNASWPNDGAYQLGNNYISYGRCEYF